VRVARLASVAGLLLLAANLQAQQNVTVADIGPGASGRILQDALRRPHRIVEPDTAWFQLRRSESVRSNLIVLGRTAAIAGKVDGDVIVVGGDLFVRPGAEISGRGVAIGGGVYPSSLAFIGQGSQSFRDNTFDIQQTPDGYRLTYSSLRVDDSRPLFLPYLYGLRFPSYDRVNGLSLPFGPTLTFAGGRGEVNALVTYRSDLGKFDPRISGELELSRRMRVGLNLERGTFSNDAWIWPDYVNSLSAIALGTDTRNYYRADRVDFTMHRVWEFTRTTVEPFLGYRFEKSWPVGPAFGESRGPWSALRRTDSLGMFRPNPAVIAGEIGSAIGGTAIAWESGGVKLSGRTQAERSVQLGSPLTVPGASVDFTQVTSDLNVGFLTFGEQEYQVDVHWVSTLGNTPPMQRFVYLGGPGTMPFLDLLEQGGDELLLVDQRYAIPLNNVRVGMFGVPTLQFRHRLGSAGLGKLPDLEQVIGVGISLTVIRGEVQLDPSTRKVRFGAGFTFSR
jgi:hypothetical protein